MSVWTDDFITHICQLFVEAKNEQGKRGQNKNRMAYQQTVESLQKMGVVDTSKLFNMLDASYNPIGIFMHVAFIEQLHSNGLLPVPVELDSVEVTNQT